MSAYLSRYEILGAVKSIISNRKYLYSHAMSPVDAAKWAAIAKIERHMIVVRAASLEGVMKMILFLRPEFELIMPGQKSKYYSSIRGKYDAIIENIENYYNPKQNA